MHDHEGACYSGVFYADTGNSTDKYSGILILCKPSSSKDGAVLKYCGVRPVTGQVIIFPGDMLHAVTPFESSEAGDSRISFSFNLLTEQEEPQEASVQSKRKRCDHELQLTEEFESDPSASRSPP